MMPNRYLPSPLSNMVEERHETMLDKGKGGDADDYPPEYEALVQMLKPEHQREFKKRRGELDE